GVGGGGGDGGGGGGVEVGDADAGEVAQKEVGGEGGAEEAGPAGHDRGGHRRDATDALSRQWQTLRPLYSPSQRHRVSTLERRRQKHLLLILARELASNLATPTLIADAQGTPVFYNQPPHTTIRPPS